MDPPHLNSRSRYDPLPLPPSHFLEPNYYPNHPNLSFPPPPPPPLRNRHQQHRNDRDRHFPDNQRLHLPYVHAPDPRPFEPLPLPPPPPPPPRVPNRILLPEGHPSPRTHLPGRGEPFRREFWDDRGVDVDKFDKFRVFDQRPNPIRSEWEREARQGPMHSYQDLTYPPEDALVDRKRYRWDHDRDFEEEDSGRGRQRRLKFCDGEGRHHHHHHHRDHIFEHAPHNASFPAASTSSPGVSRFGPVPSRGGGEASSSSSSLFERRIPPPYLLPASHSRPLPDMEVFNKKSMLDSHSSTVATDHDYRENHYVDNIGKRRLSGGYTHDIVCTRGGYTHDTVCTPSRQKPNVLSRIQSGISVWDRIQEKPPLELSSSSPPPPVLAPALPPPPTVPLPSFPEEQHQDIDELDLSYKSNALVAKVMVPTSSMAPSAEGKGPALQAPKKKVVKKKVVKKRTRVVVPIITVGSESMEGILKRSFSSSPHKVSGHGEVSQKAIVSDDSPHSCPMMVMKTSSADKKTASGEPTSGEAETRKPGNAIISDISSQPCHSGFAMEISNEKSAVKKSAKAEKLVEAYTMEEECMTSGEKASPNFSSPVAPNMWVPHDASSLIFTQGATEILASLENVSAERSPKTIVIVENEIAENPDKQMPQIMEAVENSVQSDGVFMPSIKESSISGVGAGASAQVLTPVGSATLFISGDSLEGRSIEEREKWQQLDIGMVNEELKTLGGKSGLGDPSLNSHVPNTSAVLLQEVEDMDLHQTLVDGAIYAEHIGMTLGQDLQVASSRMVQPLPFRHSKVDSLVIMSKVHGVGQSSNDNHTSNQDEKPNSKDDTLLSSKKPLASEAGEDVKSDKTMLVHIPIPGKAQLLSQHQPRKPITGDLKVAAKDSLSRKTNLSSGVQKVNPNRMSLERSVKEIAHSSHSARNKTWHRNNTPSFASPSQGALQFPGSGSMHKQSPKKLSRPHNSYIRKGNSLIRKSSTEVFPLQQSYGLGLSSRMSKHVTKRSTGDEIKVDATIHGSCSTPPVERPKTPPLPLGTKLSNYNMNPLKDFPHSTSEDLVSETGVETQVGPLENRTVDLLSGSLDNQDIMVCKTNEPPETKRMIYVKHKSYQLAAAPGSEMGDSSTHTTERAQMLTSTTASDLYYKRKKNQLILSALSSDSQQKRDVISFADHLNSEDQRTSMVPSLKCNTTSVFKKRLDKVLRTCEHPKFSLVWTSSGEKWHKKGVTSLNRWKALPHLFPWKRTVYHRKNSISNNASTSNRQSISFISRKLKLTRKRDTIYKVSTDGYSLQKTGVLSIGGSSLKWSKSIERRSKMASEEATLAVAEVQRKKREGKRSTCIASSKKNGNRLPRERIFRVGSARYKMDSSKRTLIRIPDEQASCVTGQPSGNNRQISFSPRRLLIGNDEYVRIGNGNQLVRDPKKLIRILASEKIRWSLHTARSRLARKKQYCQFFTRFGKCNKNGGKCPYIHDSSKVAICTKFVRGLCSNTNCKLTHKVIPERMPDCSYFLQGLCTNTNCPYRHVNVNPSSSVCEGFLKGYCSDGDECQKKHSYVCPLFQATGRCPQGSKCKLHHPKMANKSKKRKLLKDESNIRGRYFGSSINDVGVHLVVDSDKLEMIGGDLFCSDGRFADYVGLDVGSDDDGIETNVPMDSHQAQWDSYLSRMQPDELDALIKPVQIMNKAVQLNTTPCQPLI